MHAKTMFKIVSWDEESFDDPEGDLKLTRAHVKKSFEGDLIGTGNLMYVMMYLDSGGASFSGFEKGCGQLRRADRQLRATARGVLRRRQSHGGVRGGAGSGTDELADLSGTGGFSAGHAEEHEMALEYEI